MTQDQSSRRDPEADLNMGQGPGSVPTGGHRSNHPGEREQPEAPLDLRHEPQVVPDEERPVRQDTDSPTAPDEERPVAVDDEDRPEGPPESLDDTPDPLT